MDFRNLITVFLSVILLSLSHQAHAEYLPLEIKKRFQKQADAFGITSWKKSEKGDTWIANTTWEGLLISVGSAGAGFMASIRNEDQAFSRSVLCMIVGQIGIDPDNEDHAKKVNKVVEEAITNSRAVSTFLNGIKFEVKPEQVGNFVMLTCLLSPGDTD